MRHNFKELQIEFEELIKKLHRCTELGQQMAKILQSDSTQIVGYRHKQHANEVLKNWDEEMKQ